MKEVEELGHLCIKHYNDIRYKKFIIDIREENGIQRINERDICKSNKYVNNMSNNINNNAIVENRIKK